MYKVKPFATIARCLAALLLPAALLTMTACDSMIYDEEGDCDPYYKVRFVFDRNMNFADAFAKEVNEVTLYLVDDRSGKIVWQRHDDSDELRKEGYLMDVDVAPGNYSLIAWCGEGHTTHFTVADAQMHRHLTCTLNAREEHNNDFGFGGSAVRTDLKRLYHGKLMNQNFPDTQGVHIYTVELTKNTNDVHVVLQHMSGDPVDESKFTFTITEDNGTMAWDNSLLDDETLTYYPTRQRSGMAGVDIPDYKGDGQGNPSRAITAVSAAVADFTVARLMADKKMMVRVYNDKKELVASIPLIDYAKITKGRYEDMDDQEYLDRRNDYSLVLFLDDNGRWFSSQIYINSWLLIRQESEV